MNEFRGWWSQPDQYVWLSGYLAARHLTAICRYLLALSMAGLSAALGLMLLSPSGPKGVVSRTALVAIVTGLAAMALVYGNRWPSRRLSHVFSALGSVAIAVAALTEANPLSGLLTCAAFAGLAGYVAFFHGARLLLWTLAVAVVTAVTACVQVAFDGDIAMAVSKLLIFCGALLAVPICGQVLVSWLRVDATKSSTDTLTGLANRRGFRRSVQDVLHNAAAAGGGHLSVVMIDLDGFKKLNDEYGHATGDLVLVDVADRMRRVSGKNAVVARVGGEEFLVATTVFGSEIDMTAERIRSAIAATEWGVTASLGVTSIELTNVTGSHDGEVIDGLISAADKAMYEAKRAGGNQVCHI